MLRPKYVRHIKVRSEKLRAIMHDMWILGNDSLNLPHDAEGTEERRKAVLDRMVKEGYACLEEYTRIGALPGDLDDTPLINVKV